MDDVIGAFISFAAAAIGGWTITFGSRAVAKRFGVLAQPSARRKHKNPTPLLGGLGIYCVIVAALAFATRSFPVPYLASFFVAVTLVFAVGVVDDWVELKAGPKFFAQFVAAVLVLAFDPNLPRVFSDFGVNPWMGYCVAWIWLVGITNAFNLIDGLDGLCSGTAMLAAGAIALLAPSSGFGAFMALVVSGASAGFLIHNYNPAKIFLGDSGSLLLGFALAALSLHIPFTGTLTLSLGVFGFLFGIPILDTSLAILRRATQKRPVFSGDRGHLHHRLVNLGLPTRTCFHALFAVQAYATAAGVIVSHGVGGWASVTLALPVALFFLQGLRVTEYLISYQSARLSYLFLTDELDKLADTARVASFAREQAQRFVQTREGFSVVVIDCSGYLKQIVADKPIRLVTFYVSLYGTLKARLRSTDLIARPSEMQFAIILPCAWEVEGSHSPVFEFLQTELMRIQDAYGIYRPDSRRPEGYKVLVYPRDRTKIWRALGIDEGEQEAPAPESQVPAERAA